MFCGQILALLFCYILKALRNLVIFNVAQSSINAKISRQTFLELFNPTSLELFGIIKDE
jgi:hypothetical protein